MGQAKFNPTAIAAKAGQLPPRPNKPSKRQQEAMLAALIAKKTGLDGLYRTMAARTGLY